MRTFRACFKFQIKEFLVKRNLVLAALFLVLAAYFVHSGSSQYKDIIEEKDHFVKSEKKTVENYQNYHKYGVFGLRIKFLPSPLSIFFFNSGIFSNLNSEFNIGERLSINMSLKGKDMFESKPSNNSDFNGLLLIFGTLAVLLYGFETVRSMDFFKMAARLTYNEKIYLPMSISRFLVISLFFFLVFSLGIVIVLLNGIHLSGHDYLLMVIYYVLWLVISGFFFWIGCYIGQHGYKKSRLLPIFLTWILVVYVFPQAINKITMERSRSMAANHQMELEKWEYLMKFEERANKEVGKYSKEKANTQEGMDLMESFWIREHKDMMDVDRKLIEVEKKIIDFYRWISTSTPLTFLNDVSAEIGSNGYENIVRFQEYSWKTKLEFCKYTTQKRIQDNEPKDKKLEPFIKSEENVFYGKSRLSRALSFRILFYVALLAVLILLSYRRFKASLNRIDPKDIKSLNDRTGKDHDGKMAKEDIEIKAGEIQPILTDGPLLKDILFSLLSGKNDEAVKNGFIDTVLLKGKDILKVKNDEDFLFICPFDALPQKVKIGTIFSFCADLQGLTRQRRVKIIDSHNLKTLWGKKAEKLDDGERIKLFTAIAHIKTCPVYLFYETVTGMTADKALDFVTALKELTGKGAAVIYLSTNLHTKEVTPKGNAFGPYPMWLEQVECLGIKKEIK